MKTPLTLPAGPIPYIEMCSLKIKFFTLKKSQKHHAFDLEHYAVIACLLILVMHLQFVYTQLKI